MDKQTALLTVFVAYVAAIPLFGLAYFLLYRRRLTHFVFARDIYSTRLAEEKLLAEDHICWLRLLLAYFEHFVADHHKGIAREERSEDTATFQLNDGRTVVIEKHIRRSPQGGTFEDAPFVRLYRADGVGEREGDVIGHGFLSDFSDWAEYMVAAVNPLQDELRAAQAHRIELDSLQPTIWRYLDFVYFSTITQSTVGYGDILPNSTSVRSVVMLQIVMAYALLVVVLNIVLST